MTGQIYLKQRDLMIADIPQVWHSPIKYVIYSDNWKYHNARRPITSSLSLYYIIIINVYFVLMTA